MGLLHYRTARFFEAADSHQLVPPASQIPKRHGWLPRKALGQRAIIQTANDQQSLDLNLIQTLSMLISSFRFGNGHFQDWHLRCQSCNLSG